MCDAVSCPSAVHTPGIFAADGTCLHDVCELTCFPPETSAPLLSSLNVSSCAPRGYAPRLEINNWDSAKVTSGLVRILVEEILGYKVEPRAISGGAEVFLRHGKGWSDMSFEVWAPLSKLTIDRDGGLAAEEELLFTYEDNGVQSSGSTYFYMDESGLFAEHPELATPSVGWKDPVLLDLLPPDGTVPDYKLRVDPLNTTSEYYCEGNPWGGNTTCMYVCSETSASEQHVFPPPGLAAARQRST